MSRCCQEVLAELFGVEWKLVVASDEETLPEHAICIWDINPGVRKIPDTFNPSNLSKQLFVLDRKDLRLIQERLGTRYLHILFKPVTHATLSAFLDSTYGHLKDSGKGPVMRWRYERDEMLQCLIQANLKLQESGQERTNFLARSVHDFRSPLTALTGYCELLLDEELGVLTGDQQDIIRRMHHSAKRLSRMADAMFQLGIVHKVGPLPSRQTADIRDSIDLALHEVGPFVEGKRLAISVDVAPPPADLCFERSQIEQLIITLLDNACKFTPRLGSIDIQGYPYFWERRAGPGAGLDPLLDRRGRDVREPNTFRIDIRDSGPGIPAVDLESIFEEYTSYSGAQDRSSGGLGLAISKMIVTQHQGRIWAETSPAGAVFSFVLPFRPADSASFGGGGETVAKPHRVA